MSVEERLWRMNPAYGHAPFVSARGIADERVVHVHLTNSQEPQNTMAEALAQCKAHVRVNWTEVRDPAAELLEAAERIEPTLVFMQLQRQGPITPAVIGKLRSHLSARGVVVVWSGDLLGSNSLMQDDFLRQMHGAADLMLFSNMTHVRVLRSRGLGRVGYLQIGYDEDRYAPPPGPVEAKYDCVFLGQPYPREVPTMGVTDGPLRAEVAQRLCAADVRFKGFGLTDPRVAPQDSAAVYHASRSALSISLVHHFEKYTSDRLFRIMGCGTLALVRRFADMEGLGLRHGDNALAWETPAQALEALQSHPGQSEIAARGRALVSEFHTWSYRTLELAPLLAAVRGEEIEVTRPW